jgi:hypothetical protein
MSSKSTQQQGGSFIVRIWWEQGNLSPEHRHWRGWIQHVRGGKHLYFTTLHDLNTFIEQELGIDTANEETPHGLV